MGIADYHKEWNNWCAIDINPKIERNIVLNWCDDNLCSSDWLSFGDYIRFRNSEDATIFKLKFG